MFKPYGMVKQYDFYNTYHPDAEFSCFLQSQRVQIISKIKTEEVEGKERSYEVLQYDYSATPESSPLLSVNAFFEKVTPALHTPWSSCEPLPKRRKYASPLTPPFSPGPSFFPSIEKILKSEECYERLPLFPLVEKVSRASKRR
jgi:hypothetical protein